MATYDLTTDALVIRAVEQGEHDRLLTLLCPDEAAYLRVMESLRQLGMLLEDAGD